MDQYLSKGFGELEPNENCRKYITHKVSNIEFKNKSFLAVYILLYPQHKYCISIIIISIMISIIRIK
jgi:hypothetical protein